jgi:hypothetical protein
MGSFNMPPGCSVSDIPGNGPADQAEEAFTESFSAIVGEMDDDRFNEIAAWVWQKIGQAYGDGYSQGINDERMAREWKESETQ